MIGLPHETDEDLDGIADLCRRVLELGRSAARKRGKAGRVRVNVSVSSFVPKPHTPFQWYGQNSREELARKQDYLRERMRMRGLSVSFHDVEASFLEAAFARGGRELAPAIERAMALGCRFDGWSDQFRADLWRQAFEEVGVDPSKWANASYDFDQRLPWDHIAWVSRIFSGEKAAAARRTHSRLPCGTAQDRRMRGRREPSGRRGVE